MIELILAKDINNGISKNGIIPWKSQVDMKHFYKITYGNIVIMGKNTYFSLPEKNRPLKNRLNIVLTKTPENYIHLNSNNLVFTNNDDIIKNISNLLLDNDNKEFFPYLNRANLKIIIIGGKQIYEKYISLCDTLWVTTIKNDYSCDLFFSYEYDKLFEENIYYDDKDITIYKYVKILSSKL